MKILGNYNHDMFSQVFSKSLAKDEGHLIFVFRFYYSFGEIGQSMRVGTFLLSFLSDVQLCQCVLSRFIKDFFSCVDEIVFLKLMLSLLAEAFSSCTLDKL